MISHQVHTTLLLLLVLLFCQQQLVVEARCRVTIYYKDTRSQSDSIRAFSYNRRDRFCWTAFNRRRIRDGQSARLECRRQRNKHCQIDIARIGRMSRDSPVEGRTRCYGSPWMFQAKCGRSYLVYDVINVPTGAPGGMWQARVCDTEERTCRRRLKG